MNFDNSEQVDALAKLPPEPPKPAERSIWSLVPRAVAGGAAKVGAATVDALDTVGDAAGKRKAFERQGLKAPETDLGTIATSARDFERDMRPDPVTAGTAEQLVYGAVSGLTAAGLGAVLGGAPGAAIGMGAAEGAATADDLRRQGVDPTTARNAGLVVGGVGAASVALPMAGPTLKATAGLYLAGGPAGYMAQQEAVSQILSGAGYAKIAEQYDPLDPVGLAVSALVPLPFAGYAAVRNVRAARAARAAEVPGTAGTAGIDNPPSPVPVPGEPVKPAEPPKPVEPAPVPRAPETAPEVVDAAMVHNLTLQRDVAESRLQGVSSQISRGIVDSMTGVSQSVLDAAQRVRDFVAGPASRAGDNSSKINFAEVSADAAARIKETTGLEINVGARQDMRADAARHATGRHPDLTLEDWGMLPWMAEHFDQAVLLRREGNDKGPRIALVAIDQITGHAYVAEYLVGRKLGERLSLVTYFKDKPGAVESYLRTHRREGDGGAGGGTPDAPMVPREPQVPTSKTDSGGWRILAGTVDSLAASTDPGVRNVAEGLRLAAKDIERLQAALPAGDAGGFVQSLETAAKEVDGARKAGQTLADYLRARDGGDMPAAVNNLMIGLAEAARSPKRVAALVRQLADAADQAKAAAEPQSAGDVTANAVERMRTLTDEQLAGSDAPAPKAGADALVQSVNDRMAALEVAAPDMVVRLDADGNPITLRDELARIRRESAEGTDTTLGGDDAPLVQVAANCALSMGA